MNTLPSCQLPREFVVVASLLALAAGHSGCVTRGYKLAPKDVPPATALNLPAIGPASQPAVEATLHTVIVYRGPGSWKREAYWDEYVLSIVNRSDAPLAITSATLHSASSEPVTPGDNPWAIEKLSKKWWQSNAARQGGTYLALGAGATAGGAVVVATMWSTSAGAAAVGTAGAAAFVALPVFAVGTAFANVHGKHKVEAEFARRRLALPATIPPGGNAQGSLFFRVTPAPQRLALACRTGDQTHDLVFDLSPLAHLHLKPAADAAPPPARATSPPQP